MHSVLKKQVHTETIVLIRGIKRMKMKKLSALCLAGSLLGASSLAMAWESEDGQHSTSASVALGTDYVWRGYSQTDEDPAISGSFDYAHASGLYVGTWASNVNFDDADGDTAHMELDIYAGFGGEFGESGLGYDLGVLRYIYPGSEGLDWNEFYGSLSYSFFNVGVAYSGDVYNSSETGIYYSAGFDYDLPGEVALSAGVGLYDYDDEVSDDNHTDYHIGLSRDFIGFGFDVSYYGMDSDGRDAYGDSGDSRFVFTISKSM